MSVQTPGVRPAEHADPAADRPHRQGRREADHDVARSPLSTACDYCCAHADAQLQASDILAGELKRAQPLAAVRRYRDAADARARPHGADRRRGRRRCSSRCRARCTRNSQTIEREIYAIVGHEFNIGSPQQLSHVLFDEIGLPKTRKTKLGYTTDAQSRWTSCAACTRSIDLILRIPRARRSSSPRTSTRCRRWSTRRRAASTRRSTRRRRRPAGSRRTTRTCRTSPCARSCGNAIRRAFVARDIGAEPMLLAADYSQIELRIMAHLSQDPALIEAFRDRRGHPRGDGVAASSACRSTR